MSSEVEQRAARIKLLLMDCDGVLTDGRICSSKTAKSRKVFTRATDSESNCSTEPVCALGSSRVERRALLRLVRERWGCRS